MSELPKPQKKPVLKTHNLLTLKGVQQGSSQPVFIRGIRYFLRNRVVQYQELSPEVIEAQVSGSGEQPYTVTITLSAVEQFQSNCSCPYFEEVCKHGVAVLLNYLQRRDRMIRSTVKEFLEQNQRQRPKNEGLSPDTEGFLDPEEIQNSGPPQVTLGLLVLPRPLALILGLMPDKPQGKVNILKIPEPALATLEVGSPARKLGEYLLALPQTVTGPAGGHRIPQGQEATVLAYARHAVKLVEVGSGKSVRFAERQTQVRLVMQETETGDIQGTLIAHYDNQVLVDPLFILGNPLWILSQNIFYCCELRGLGNLITQFDSTGLLLLKEHQVPSFLIKTWPKLQEFVQISGANWPQVIQEPPKVVVTLSERPEDQKLVFQLNFRYGAVVLPAEHLIQDRDQVYTRHLTEEGQSYWISRLASQEMQLRQVLQNLQPDRTSGHRYYFSGERGLEILTFIRQYGSSWEVQGLEDLTNYRIHPEPLTLKAHLTLEKPRFHLGLTVANSQITADREVLQGLLAKGQTYYLGTDGVYAAFPARALDRVLRLIGDQDQLYPLYQVLPLVEQLTVEEVTITYDAEFTSFLAQLRNFESLPVLPLPVGLNAELRSYQVSGVNWLRFLARFGLSGILADDMGLGKTIQTLTALLSLHSEEPQTPPSLVIVPTSVVYNWQDEARKFTPKLRTELFVGPDRQEIFKRPKLPQVVFTTYGILRRDIDFLKSQRLSYVILDEAQMIKNPESVSAKAVKQLQGLHTLALSGTPIENRLLELWSIFDFLMPDFLATNKLFQERYEKPIAGGDPQAAQELQRRIKPFILRRLKTQVEKDLPPKTDMVRYCSLQPQQQSLYLQTLQQCRSQIFGEITSGGVGRSQMSILAALLRLRQVCCDPRLVEAEKYTAEDSAKLLELMDLLETILAEGHRVLLFSQFVTMLTLLKRSLEQSRISYEYIDGGTTAKERKERVERFNLDNRLQVFLISLKAGGTGLNLTGADYVIHYDPWWNPAVEAQATDRAYRIGQTRPVFNYKLITRGTIEEKVIQLQKSKAELAEQVLSEDSVFVKSLTQKDLEFLFS